jgi:hypothetical protein
VRTLTGMTLGAIIGVLMGKEAVVFEKPCGAMMGLVQMLAAPNRDWFFGRES